MADVFAGVTGLLRRGVEERAFPGAAIEVGRHDGPRWTAAVGALTYEPAAAPVTHATVYDLASLSKVIATTTLAMGHVERGAMSLDQRVAEWIPRWRGADREAVTIRDLLAHSAGLTAYLPFFRDHAGRREFEEAICRIPLEYAPRTRSIYSDLGFILLGFILEDAARAGARSDSTQHRDTSLAAQFAAIAGSFGEALCFNPPRSWRPIIAPTEVDPWRGRLLVGEVHDENAWALGGAAGHTGLFGTAGAVGAFARAVLRTIGGERVIAAPGTMRAFAARAGIAGSSRALGWDTMLPTSSCGTKLSPSSIGHTGFTGTSLWIDFVRDLYVVLLTNRVHPTRENIAIRRIRPQVHDAVVDAAEAW